MIESEETDLWKYCPCERVECLKSDVRRSRVRNKVPETFDKHDRVNYAALSSKLHVDTHKKVITLNIELDESICSMIDYFEIFSQRMLMCKRAAEVLGLRFKLVANGNKIAWRVWLSYNYDKTYIFRSLSKKRRHLIFNI